MANQYADNYSKTTEAFQFYNQDFNMYCTCICICMKDDLQLGKLKENCLLLKLYRKLRKMFLSPRLESNPQPSDLR